ncbi:hypothetical protein BDR03DRAFT_966055 [Suillus americanus]|nr:hypothetical protein BDR03DRAFT_966055 [Suillus americanus]
MTRHPKTNYHVSNESSTYGNDTKLRERHRREEDNDNICHGGANIQKMRTFRL